MILSQFSKIKKIKEGFLFKDEITYYIGKNVKDKTKVYSHNPITLKSTERSHIVRNSFSGMIIRNGIYSFYNKGTFSQLNNYPLEIITNTEGRFQRVSHWYDLYGEKVIADHFYNKYGSLIKICFYSKYDINTQEKHPHNLIKYVQNGQYGQFCTNSYATTRFIENWLVNHGYEKGDILNMSPEDFNIMKFELMIKH